MPDPRDFLLAVAFRRSLRAANAEEGLEQVRQLAGGDPSLAALQDAVAASVREGLIRDPVRLEDGALQCHWRLELTPTGVASARSAAERLAPERNERRAGAVANIRARAWALSADYVFDRDEANER